MRCSAHTTLDVADRADAYPCPFGKLLLSQSGGHAIAAKQVPKVRPRSRVHGSSLARLRRHDAPTGSRPSLPIRAADTANLAREPPHFHVSEQADVAFLPAVLPIPRRHALPHDGDWDRGRKRSGT